MSLGETDKKWWDLISQWLSKSDKRMLVILQHDGKYSSRFPHVQDRVIRPIRKRFLSYSTLPEEIQRKISERIFIGINNDVFAMSLFNDEKFEQEMENMATEATVLAIV